MAAIEDDEDVVGWQGTDFFEKLFDADVVAPVLDDSGRSSFKRNQKAY
jgi:hypothetical protein